MSLAGLAEDVEWPDGEAARAAAPRHRSGGTLDDLAAWLAGLHGCVPAREITRPRVLLFPGTPAGPVHAVAEVLDLPVDVVAAAPASVPAALAAGAGYADSLVDTGADLLVFCAAGLPVTREVVTALFTDTEPVRVLPRGSVLSTAEWISLATRVRDGRLALRDADRDPDRVLDLAADPDLAFLTGCLVRAVARRTPIVLDGPAAVTAAVVGYRVQPRITRWLRLADDTAEPIQAAAQRSLSLPTVLSLQSLGPDAAAGPLAVPVLRAAVARARAGSANV
jgi:NaMN:DMB phosphoribosyltransferase